jgi:flagellar biosynthesis component FlhA
MNPESVRDLMQRFRAKIPAAQTSAAVVTSSGARHFLRQILETSFPNLAVLAHNEIPADITVRSRGLIE